MKVELDLDQNELDWIIECVKEDFDYNHHKYKLNEDERLTWGLNIEMLAEIINKLQKARNNMPIVKY